MSIEYVLAGGVLVGLIWLTLAVRRSAIQDRMDSLSPLAQALPRIFAPGSDDLGGHGKDIFH